MSDHPLKLLVHLSMSFQYVEVKLLEVDGGVVNSRCKMPSRTGVYNPITRLAHDGIKDTFNGTRHLQWRSFSGVEAANTLNFHKQILILVTRSDEKRFASKTWSAPSWTLLREIKLFQIFNRKHGSSFPFISHCSTKQSSQACEIWMIFKVEVWEIRFWGELM